MAQNIYDRLYEPGVALLPPVSWDQIACARILHEPLSAEAWPRSVAPVEPAAAPSLRGNFLAHGIAVG